MKLLFFASLYGRNQEILARLGREKIFLKDLGASEDKVKVVLFRLFKEIDEGKAREITEDYIRTYSEQMEGVRSAIGSVDEYRAQMFRTFPLHPELVDVLFESYGSSKNYQNTRGILYLLSGALRKSYEERELLLPSDVDPEYEEIHDDLYQLNPDLLDRCVEDIRRTKDDKLSRGILATILLHSFIPERAGCDESQILLGSLRPGLNINEIYRVLGKIEGSAWYLWRTDGRYVIRTEENLPVSITSRAERILQEEGTDQAKGKLREMIKGELKGAETYVYPLEEIPEGRQVKVVVSTKYMEGDEITNSVYFGKEWRNTLIFIRPKTAGDLAESRDPLLKAQKLLVCEELEKPGQLAKEKLPQLKEIKDREEEEIKSKIQGNYGEWMKAAWREDKIYFRPVDCSLKAEDILDKIRETFATEATEEAILSELEEAKEKGRRLDELRTTFLKQPGKPIILDSGVLRERVRALCQSGEIILERGRSLYSKDNLPGDIPDDMVLYLKEHGPTPPEERQIEEGAEEPTSEEVSIGVRTGYEEGEEPGGVISEAKTTPIETSKHATPFNLQTEIEGKLVERDKVRQAIVSIFGKGLEEAAKLEELTSKVEDGESKIFVEITLKFPKGIDKGRFLRILDNLPIPTNGDVRANLEVEK